MKIATKSILAVVVASAATMWCAQLGAQSLAPQVTLRSGPATEVQAEENFVMQQPAASYGVPFRSTMGASAYAAAKQAAANYSPLALKRGTNGPVPAAPPTMVFHNFDGASSVDGLRPPDTHGAVGLKHFVEVTNSHIDVFNKSTQALAKSVSLATFFSYKLNVTFFTGDFWDYPQLGFDQDAVLFTANIFASGGSFKGADFFAVAKARLYNGLGFSVPVSTGLVGTLAPPIVLDQNAKTFLLAAPTSGTTFTKYTMTNS